MMAPPFCKFYKNLGARQLHELLCGNGRKFAREIARVVRAKSKGNERTHVAKEGGADVVGQLREVSMREGERKAVLARLGNLAISYRT